MRVARLSLVAVLLMVMGSAVLRAQSPSVAVLTSMVPNHAPAGATTALTITLTGNDFTSDSAVYFGGLVETTFINSTTLSAIVPPAQLASPAIGNVYVNNVSTQRSSNALPFYVFPNAPPTINRLTANIGQLTFTDPAQVPATAVAAGGGTELYIAGNNLLGATVTVGGGDVTVSYQAPGSLQGAFIYSSNPLLGFTNTFIQIRFSAAPGAAVDHDSKSERSRRQLRRPTLHAQGY